MNFNAYALIMGSNDRFLVNEDAEKNLILPGGKVEPGMSPIETVLHALDKCGVKISQSYISEINHFFQNSSNELIVTYYIPVHYVSAASLASGALKWASSNDLMSSKKIGTYAIELFDYYGYPTPKKNKKVPRIGLEM